VLRRIFGYKWDEVAGGWRRLHDEELHNFYASPSLIIRVFKLRGMRWVGHVASMVVMRNAYRSLIGKSEGRIPLGRLRRDWTDNIRLDLRETGWERVDWILLDQWWAVVNTVMSLWVP
jgi:hypothetical protein